MKILICGGRDFVSYKILAKVLDRLHKRLGFILVIHGAARGADRLGKAWGAARGLPVAAYPAQWAKYGLAAGAIRNSHMLAHSMPDVVIAFAGSTGTADMLKKAYIEQRKRPSLIIIDAADPDLLKIT